MYGKRGNQIGGIEPISTPIPHRINQVIVKELAFKTLAKLDPIVAKNIGFFTARLRLQTKEVAEKRKRRRNFKESFTEMNENRKMENGIRG